VLTPNKEEDMAEVRKPIDDDPLGRYMKLPEDRLEVTITIQIKGKLRRADIDRFTQSMGKTAALEFENGGNGR
jgi:hypothetical protein